MNGRKVCEIVIAEKRVDAVGIAVKPVGKLIGSEFEEVCSFGDGDLEYFVILN